MGSIASIANMAACKAYIPCAKYFCASHSIGSERGVWKSQQMNRLLHFSYSCTAISDIDRRIWRHPRVGQHAALNISTHAPPIMPVLGGLVDLPKRHDCCVGENVEWFQELPRRRFNSARWSARSGYFSGLRHTPSAILKLCSCLAVTASRLVND